MFSRRLAVCLCLLGSILTWPAVAQSVGGAVLGKPAPADRDAKSAPVLLRASDFIGETVRNGQGQIVGSVDDLILDRSDKVVSAVLSVGGFLGVGDKLVAVPFDEISVGVLEVEGLLLYDVSEEKLKQLPAFTYSFDSEEQRMNQALRSAQWRIQKWESRIERRTRDVKKDAKEAKSTVSRKLDKAWENAKANWAKLKDASAEAWQKAKKEFNAAMRDLEAAWENSTS